MARPRRSSGDPDAKALLTEAFWELLAERPYRKITVKELSARAGLNHNSFYYHFQNMEELAQFALSTNIPSEALEVTLPRFLSCGEASLPLPLEQAEPLFQRMKLFCKSDSPELHIIIRKQLEEIWKHAANIDDAAAPNDRSMALSFISAGAVATIGANKDFTVSDFLAMANKPTGKAIRSILVGS